MKPNEFHTRSTPTAAMLKLMGFEPLRIEYRQHAGASTVVFAGEARAVVEKFRAFKEEIDSLLFNADSLR